MSLNYMEMTESKWMTIEMNVRHTNRSAIAVAIFTTTTASNMRREQNIWKGDHSRLCSKWFGSSAASSVQPDTTQHLYIIRFGLVMQIEYEMTKNSLWEYFFFDYVSNECVHTVQATKCIHIYIYHIHIYSTTKKLSMRIMGHFVVI